LEDGERVNPKWDNLVRAWKYFNTVLSEFIFWLYLIHYKIVDFHYTLCMLSLVRIPTGTHSKKILLYTK
jgi:hypothetical protein